MGLFFKKSPPALKWGGRKLAREYSTGNKTIKATWPTDNGIPSRRPHRPSPSLPPTRIPDRSKLGRRLRPRDPLPPPPLLRSPLFTRVRLLRGAKRASKWRRKVSEREYRCCCTTLILFQFSYRRFFTRCSRFPFVPFVRPFPRL